MAAVYPLQTRAFTTKLDLTDTVYAVHINDLQDEMTAVQGALGTAPQGAYPSVKARLDFIDTSKAATGHDHPNRLDAAAHDVSTRHLFGAAFPTPAAGEMQTIVITSATQAAAPGTSQTPARNDHFHGLPSQAALLDMLIPPGVIWAWGGTALPPGTWLWCDGSAVLRATYAVLFTNIGTRYGVGNGTTTFNVPNYLGRMLIGGATTGAAVTSGGQRDANIISHNHPGSSVSGNNADHQHYVDHTHWVGNDNNGLHVHTMTPPDYGDRAVNTFGGAQSDYLYRGPNDRGIGVSFSHIYTGNGAHNHGNTGGMDGRQYTDLANNSGNHGHGLTIALDGVGSGGVLTDGRMPPYQTCNFIIKAG